MTRFFNLSGMGTRSQMSQEIRRDGEKQYTAERERYTFIVVEELHFERGIRMFLSIMHMNTINPIDRSPTIQPNDL